MKISFKHRSNLYLNCTRTSSVYRCNNVSVNYQHPTCASSQNQQLPTVTDQCMHIQLPEFAIKHNETYYTISECTDELFIFLNSK